VPPAPQINDAKAAARLRAACTEAGFTEDAVRARLFVPAGLPVFAAGVLHDLELADADDRLSVLLRLLVRGTPVDAAAAEAALAPATVDDLIAMGMAVRDGDGTVRTTVRLMPVHGLLLLADRGGSDAPADIVLGDNGPANILAALTSRRPVDRTLDLGTGGGVQALLAAAHSRHVTATDVNERALAFARANAALNGIDGVEWVQGSWLEPVAGQRFDLIVVNPPYIISPDTSFLYRDGGQDGDGVTRHVVTEAARHLAHGGMAFAMGNWAVDPAPDADWSEPVRRWLAEADCGCDALVFRIEPMSAADYAARWTLPNLSKGTREYEAAARRWRDHTRALGISAVAFGAVALRRTDGPARVRAVDVIGGPTAPCGEHVVRLLDRLGGGGDSDVDLDRCYRLVEGLRIEQTLTRRDGRYRSHPALVRLTPGLPVKAAVDPAVLRVLFACDGTRPLRELAAGADVDKVADAVRVLLHTGLAEAAGEAYRP